MDSVGQGQVGVALEYPRVSPLSRKERGLTEVSGAIH
ncbi:hypothetical protein PS925_03118 [Pseudomonas fluorescens]|uniref:Uncharacterized protein n=1 Tax=Pseudomonas fluorescens TaxID=294 RepID=A0A5E7ULG1_PSEFL|nr:hypothetical protein PS925_03118 [Pseudomonas fluorescens]